jgi:hypothetical protein
LLYGIRKSHDEKIKRNNFLPWTQGCPSTVLTMLKSKLSGIQDIAQE